MSKTRDDVKNSLMVYLCRNHDINVKNGLPTEFEIEQIKNQTFPNTLEKYHFEDIIKEIDNSDGGIQISK